MIAAADRGEKDESIKITREVLDASIGGKVGSGKWNH